MISRNEVLPIATILRINEIDGYLLRSPIEDAIGYWEVQERVALHELLAQLKAQRDLAGTMQ